MALEPHYLEEYTIHSRCWTLTEIIIGSETVHSHLDRVVAALRFQWESIIARLELKTDLPYSIAETLQVRAKLSICRYISGQDLNNPLYMHLLVKYSCYPIQLGRHTFPGNLGSRWK